MNHKVLTSSFKGTKKLTSNKLLIPLFILLYSVCNAQIVTSVVGNGTSGFSGDGGQASAAEINAIMGVATDVSGNLYIADQGNQRVRKVNTSGVISTFAGTGTAGFSGDGGQATAAKVSSPIDIAFDASGNVYIVDKSNNRIRKVNTSGVISTIAGNGTAGYNGDGGQATAAEVSNARGITIDASGNIYFADLGNNVVREINTSGVISTFAGNGVSGFSGDGGQATAAEINNVQRVLADNSGNIYIADGNNARIRKVNTSGVISTFAGTGTAGFSGTGGPATAAKINSPHGMTFDAAGNMYFTNIGNNRTEKINTSNVISLIAGNGTAGYSGDGGQAAAAEFNSPDDVAPEPTGNLYIGDAANNRVRIVYLVLKVTATVTSNVSCYGGSNGSASSTVSNGTSPYTYSWYPGSPNTSTITGLSAGTYTLTVTDNVGVTGTASVTIIQPGPVPTPTIVVFNTDSIAYRASTYTGDTLRYSWALLDMTGSYSGILDTAYMPVLPRNATLTFTATTPTIGCTASASLYIANHIDLSIYSKPYPRWSKRGMYLEWAAYYIDSTYDWSYNKITPVVNYCAKNHITYVLLGGLQYDPSDSGWVFGISNKWVDSVHALHLESFIDSLKTRGGVEQVGVECYNNGITTDTSQAFNVENFDQAEFNDHIHRYTYGLPWNKKIDVLSLDEEFWRGYDTSSGAFGWAGSLNDFHTLHMPMLKAMYNAAHSCPDNYLRVEDYLETPLNVMGNAVLLTDSLYTNWTSAMEVDSIGIYADRLLLGSYTQFGEALWNRGDFIQIDSAAGMNVYHNYYKKEIWPVFSAADSTGGCTKCYEDMDEADLSGYELCKKSKLQKAEYIENQYYDSLAVSWKKQKFTNNLNGYYAEDAMGKDTNFQILGDGWFEYECLNRENINFNSTGSGFLKFYVTLPHDTQYVRWGDLSMLHQDIPITATVHGGTGPFTYFWYDIQTGTPLGVTSSNTYTVTFSYNTLQYNATQLAVVVHQPGTIDTNVTDYMNIYQYCDQPYYPHAPHKHPKTNSTSKVHQPLFSVYPNPANSDLTLDLESSNQPTYYFDLYNVVGEKVISIELSENKTTFNISQLPSGLYFYRTLKPDGALIKSGKVEITH